MSYRDKDKQRAAWRRWYYANKPKARAAIKKAKEKLDKWYIEYKATLKCECCNESHPACLEFHHRDPKTKVREISNMVKDSWAIDTIKKEIEKCAVLCANCHRKLQYEEEVHGLQTDRDSLRSASASMLFR